MAGKSDISAGRAFVELTLKGGAEMRKGLIKAGEQLKDFGAGVGVLGAAVAGAGASIVGPLMAAVNHFSEVGSALADMSARTGKAGSELAALGYAAQQSGASMEDVEKAILAMQKKGDTRTFDEAAAAIASIEDPAERTRAAIEAFGKAGPKLMPMLQNLKALKDAAIEKGLVPTDEAIASADELGDAMDDVKSSVSALVFEIGSALAGSVTKGANTIAQIVATSIKWVRENHKLVQTVAAVGAGLVVAGGVIASIGAAIAGAGFVLTGMAAAFGAVASAVGMLFSPLGLIAAAVVGLGAAVVGGAAYWAMYTESGRKAMSAISGFLAPMLATVKKTFGGIMDAISAGDLGLAGRIAMAGLKAGLLQGVAAIATSVGGAFGDFLGTIGTQLAGGDFSGAWRTVLESVSGMWASFTESIVNMFTSAMQGVLAAWQKTTAVIADWILANSSEGGPLGNFMMGKDDEKTRSMKRQGDIGNAIVNPMAAIGAGLGKAAFGAADTAAFGQGVSMKDEQERSRKLNEQAKAMGLAEGPDALSAAQGSAREQLGAQADAFRSKLDEMDRQAAERSGNAWAPTGTKGGASGASAAADAAQAEVDRLTAAAEAIRKRNQAEDQLKKTEIEESLAAAMPSREKLDRNMAGTYSAAAAVASFGRGGTDPGLQVAKDQLKAQDLANQKLDRLISEVKEGGMVA